MILAVTVIETFGAVTTGIAVFVAAVIAVRKLSGEMAASTAQASQAIAAAANSLITPLSNENTRTRGEVRELSERIAILESKIDESTRLHKECLSREQDLLSQIETIKSKPGGRRQQDEDRNR